MTEKRFYVAESKLIDGYCVFDREKKYAFCPRPRMADCLNDAHTLNELVEENQALQRHIERNTFNKIRVEDVLNCAKYDRFYDNKEAIKSIEWIADGLGVDLDD